MNLRLAVSLCAACCMLIAFNAVVFGIVPDGETTGPKEFDDVGPYHGYGEESHHHLKVYFAYPVFGWPHVYQESESGGDAYNEIKQQGGVMERRNSSCLTDHAVVDQTASVTVSTSLGGSFTTEIKAALGWPGAGSVGLGKSGTLNWSLGVTASGTFSIETKDIPGLTIEWWYKYFWLYHRPGVAYDCVQGFCKYYCTTHSRWCTELNNQVYIVDYNGTTHTAAVVYESGDNVFFGSHAYEDNYVIPALPLSNQDITLPGDPYMEGGEHWFEY
jgi:hypothetical protein